jgi:hypothetical protein
MKKGRKKEIKGYVMPYSIFNNGILFSLLTGGYDGIA